ncbi:MAG: hypothetical protein QE269_02785 [Fimbriimonas sp.]|nr:hypothetical protein [Fimbriimonas sp.]
MIHLALAYAFAAGHPVSFDVTVQFEGWISIFGGREGKANVSMIVVANPVPPKEAGFSVSEVESSISKIEAEAFGVQLPLNSSNVDQFFPKAVATFDLQGVVIKNTAPAIKMPAKLPGLDSQRLPEISFLPLALPKTEIKEGESYSFSRTYSGQEFKYTVTLMKQNESGSDLTIKLVSTRDGFEDAYGNTLETVKGAKKKSRSELGGAGSAHFSRALGSFDKVEVETTETTTTEPLTGGKQTVKKLKTTLKIKRQTP